jgi:four helix bundle protein
VGERQSYQELIVWQRAIELTKTVYEETKSFPRDEQFGLTSQIRRAAVSIPSNIAEGQARGQSGDFCRFICIALGSAAELHTQLILAQQLGYIGGIESKSLEQRIIEIRRMLYSLLARLSK